MKLINNHLKYLIWNKVCTLLRSLVIIFSFVSFSYATILITKPGNNNYKFTNTASEKATDFHVTVSTIKNNGIDGNSSSGGTAFPDKVFGEKATPKSGYRSMEYKGGMGVASGGVYYHSFSNWPVGTVFNVQFSYADGSLRDPQGDPVDSLLSSFSPDGYTVGANDTTISSGTTVSYGTPGVSDNGRVILTLVILVAGITLIFLLRK